MEHDVLELRHLTCGRRQGKSHHTAIRRGHHELNDGDPRLFVIAEIKKSERTGRRKPRKIG
jgi:hypothetical protein